MAVSAWTARSSFHTMTLEPGEGLHLRNSKGECVISLDPDDVLPSIHLINPTQGTPALSLQMEEGRPRIIFSRPNGKHGLYIVCRGDGEVIVFHNSEGIPVLRVGFDPSSGEVLACEVPGGQRPPGTSGGS